MHGSHSGVAIVGLRSDNDPTMTDLHDVPLHRLDPARIPVVLLGGLNLVRALGLAGIPAVVATSDHEEPALDSRYCTVAVTLPPPHQHDARVDAIAALGERLAGIFGRRVPLMYGSDDALELIYAHRERLARHFLFLVADREVAESLIAKDRFQAFAESRGLPVPRALAWDGAGPGSLAACKGPVVMKPRAKRDWHQSMLCQRLFGGDGKAVVLENGRAALGNADIARFHDQLTFQECIPGDDTCLWSYHGFADEEGIVIEAFTGRKIRTYPAGMGESAYIELAPDPGLDAVARELVPRAGLRGPFKIDFKRDPRDGRWYVLEINARYTLWQYVGAANGVNLMRTAYDYLLHRERTRFPAAVPSVRWIDFSLDRRAYRQLRAEGKLSTIGWLASLVVSRKLYNLFSWRDPLPFVQRALFRLVRLSRRVGVAPARIFRRVRQWRSTAS